MNSNQEAINECITNMFNAQNNLNQLIIGSTEWKNIIIYLNTLVTELNELSK